MSLEPRTLFKLSRNRLKQRQKLCKYEKVIWPTAFNKIFKFLPHLDTFFQINYCMNPLKATRITNSKMTHIV